MLDLNDIIDQARDLCFKIAKDRKITAACFYGPKFWDCTNSVGDYDIILILEAYNRKITYRRERSGKFNAFILLVDKKIFENDVDKAFLGEFVGSRILDPYEPFINSDYLWMEEVKIKKRVITEEIESLIHRYTNICCEILIDPTFFMYKKMQKMSKIYPPLAQNYLKMLGSKGSENNVARIMKGYMAALQELQTDDVICFEGNYVRVSRMFLGRVGKTAYKIIAPFRETERMIRRYAVHGFSGATTPSIIWREISTRFEGSFKVKEDVPKMEDPERRLFLKTELGLMSLSNESTLKDTIMSGIPFGEVSNVKIEKLGGTLNSVYLIRFFKDNEERKIAAKRFEDWSNLKWLPLSLWAFGAQKFEIPGERRLENEYKMNRVLKNLKFHVPEIYYLNVKNRVLLQQFIDGLNVENIIRKILPLGYAAKKEINLLYHVAGSLAKVHCENAVIGDCKPENMILGKDNQVYLIDLEQASECGNIIWDIAEFLYYTGHFTTSSYEIRPITEVFIEGYLTEGKRENVREVASLKYRRIFSFFVAPNVITEIAKICSSI
jgi:tRNA A-37 threonylcarbamoyl transferase component Bud32/uncharacterized protein YneF (UPF0154 family)